MDPITKAWMYHNWIEDYSDEYKLLENQGYMIGSFTNPEAVRKMLGSDAQAHESTDNEFENLLKKIREDRKNEEQAKQEKVKKKRKRKIAS